ncbi:prephenate dehydrogenase/arogenate dehydrogenase family protein [Paracoccus sp. T5]|uniref:prephenate dehydrogenase/arogenate dehydrogenase family protein n=1 Tax=Paracoccus sp. T5 TaxID=3402161 RepID=UPI003ADD6A76
MHLASSSFTIVGFGAFGKLLAQLLAPMGSIFIYDRRPDVIAEVEGTDFQLVSHPREICSGIVIMAVPLQGLKDCLVEIGPHLGAGQVVIDVCSVKEEPARLMQELLPPDVEIIACHPMFGPASAANGIEGLQVVLCPLRGMTWRKIAKGLRKLQLTVSVMNAEEHDRQAALSQGLMHLIARAVLSLKGPPLIRTRSHDLLCEAIEMVAHDSPELFETITRRNPYMEEVRSKLIRGLGGVAS